MTTTPPPRTEEEFRDRLESLIREAESNGVPVEGAYALYSENGDRPNWELQLLALAERDAATD